LADFYFRQSGVAINTGDIKIALEIVDVYNEVGWERSAHVAMLTLGQINQNILDVILENQGEFSVWMMAKVPMSGRNEMPDIMKPEFFVILPSQLEYWENLPVSFIEHGVILATGERLIYSGKRPSLLGVTPRMAY
jgi:hypothetical protein